MDPKIPKTLIGDGIHLKQILLNLLGNAIKYTNEGAVTLTIRGTILEDRIDLTFNISDSGIGITQDNLETMFDQYSRVDRKRNQYVEGTGLGLAISQALAKAMHGNITVTSEYGKGSTFTLTIPQRFKDNTPVAAIENIPEKPILMLEENEMIADLIKNTFRSLKIVYSIKNNKEDFDAALKTEDFSWVIVKSDMIEHTLSLIKDKNIKVAELTSSYSTSSTGKVSNIIQTLYCDTLITLLERGGSSEEVSNNGSIIDFEAPDARILIVDDVPINLMVAEGMLSPFKMQIETVQGGEEAIAFVKQTDYDIVFMDQMMPGIDGVAATAAIRALDGEKYKSLPIIALTANAVSGTRDELISAGMNDYLTKPIIEKDLIRVLKQFLPPEKRINI